MRARVCMDLGASVFHIKNFHQYSEQLQYHLPSSSSSNASSSSIDSDTHEGNLRLTVCPSFILVRVCVGQNNESNASASKSDVASFFPFVLMQVLEACPSTPRRRLGQRSRPWVLSWVLHWPLAQTFFVQPFATQIPFRTVPEGASVKFRVSKINIIYVKCNILPWSIYIKHCERTDKCKPDTMQVLPPGWRVYADALSMRTPYERVCGDGLSQVEMKKVQSDMCWKTSCFFLSMPFLSFPFKLTIFWIVCAHPFVHFNPFQRWAVKPAFKLTLEFKLFFVFFFIFIFFFVFFHFCSSSATEWPA